MYLGLAEAAMDFALFRDVRASTLMPPTMDRMAEAIGKTALGLAEGMFRLNLT